MPLLDCAPHRLQVAGSGVLVESQAFSIIAATFHGNRGAQAMLETVIGRLSDEQPGLRFHVFSYYPEADRRLVTHPRVTLHSSTPFALVAWLLPWSLLFGLLRLVFGRRVIRIAPLAIRALASSTALVDLAGVAFIDGRERFLPFNGLTVLPAWLLGVPVVKMPQALGPFEHPMNRFAAKLVLPMCRMVWARGARTLGHLEHAAFRGTRFAPADDIAFNFQERWSLTSEGSTPLHQVVDAIEALRRQPEVRGVVGLCPSSVLAVKARRTGGLYEATLAELVGQLTGMGFALVLFPNATRDAAGEAERNNDLPVIRRLHEDCRRRGLKLPLMVDFDVSAAGIKHLIARFDIVLVSRFHAMVGALSLGVPPVVLGWSHKYAEVMARFGLEGHVMDHQQLSLEELRSVVERVFNERSGIQSQIRDRLVEVRSAAERPVTALLTPSLGADLA